MLDLINEARADAGVRPVELGDNRAAQIHAESQAEHCFSSHWGLDGTKPAWRYSQAGGYQASAENIAGISWCEGSTTPAHIQVRASMYALMDSEKHRAVILSPLRQRVNIGLAFNLHGYLMTTQQFESNYVEYQTPPHIEDNVLQLRGRLKNGAEVNEPQDLAVQVWYDPPPRPVTVGQAARTYCVDPGRQVAELEPLPAGRTAVRWKPMQADHVFCTSPRDFSHDVPPPVNNQEALDLWRVAKSQRPERQTLPVPWLPASTWKTDAMDFAVVADLTEVLAEHGPGVYSVAVRAMINGASIMVSDHYIFYEVAPPRGYGAEGSP